VSPLFRAVLFDYDDTLIDTSFAKKEAFERVSQLLTSGLDGHAPKHSLVPEISRLSEEMNERRYYDRDIWWKRIAAHYGHSISDARAAEITEAYWVILKEQSVPFPDTIHVLSTIRKKGLKIGLVTDTDGRPGLKRRRLKDSPILEYVDAIVVSGDETRYPKPDVEGFLKCSAELGISPSESLFVGDKPYTDVAGANAAGMKSVLLMRRQWRDTHSPTYMCSSLSAVLDLLGEGGEALA
jgi:putative hydrolase of the HAD superfamily